MDREKGLSGLYQKIRREVNGTVPLTVTIKKETKDKLDNYIYNKKVSQGVKTNCCQVVSDLIDNHLE